jgi:hypothetical protein
VDETDSKLIALLTHCVSEPYFDASLESILLPSCIKYVLDSTQIQNEQYPLVVGYATTTTSIHIGHLSDRFCCCYD